MNVEHTVVFLGGGGGGGRGGRVIRRPVKTTVWERTWGSIMGEENRYCVSFSLQKYVQTFIENKIFIFRFL